MQMSCRPLHRSMVRNIKETFPPKTEMGEKQLVQDPGYVEDMENGCCMLAAKYLNNTVHWFQFI